MTARELLSLLHDRGAALWADGDEIRFRAPRGAVTPELGIGNFRTLLEAVAANADQPVSDMPLLSVSAGDSAAANGAIPAAPPATSGRCLHGLIQDQAARTPNAPAIVFQGGQVTYGELNARANQLARRLRRLGVGPDTFVALCMNRTPDLVVGLLGIWKAGGVYVPLDPEYPPARLELLLHDAQATVVLTHASLVERLPRSAATVICVDADRAEIDREEPGDLETVATGASAAYVLYTSGSTGVPKGVVVDHHAIATHCCTIRDCYRVTADDCALLFHSVMFDPSLEEILPLLIAGGRVALRGDEIWLPEDCHLRLAELGVTILLLTPAYWLPVLRDWHDHPDHDPGARLRLVVIGGEFMPIECVRLWAASRVASRRLVNAYGPTEATVTTTVFDVSAHLPETLGSERVPIGRPIAGRRVYILDSAQEPVPIGVAGELYIGGSGLARGYLNRPELTAERFVPDPFREEPGARMYRTGDIAKWRADGQVEMLGRADHQVKIRGFRVELGEIEAVLSRLPGVEAAAVVALGTAAGDKRLVAHVVFRPGAEPSLVTVRAALARELAEHMVPTAFVRLERMPLLPNGKVDRSALPEPAASRPESPHAYVPPRTPIEASVATTMAEVLGIDRVGVHDDFFELGGHSLLATKVVSRLRETFAVDLPLRVIFENPTAEGLAIAVLDLLVSQDPDALDDAASGTES